MDSNDWIALAVVFYIIAAGWILGKTFYRVIKWIDER